MQQPRRAFGASFYLWLAVAILLTYILHEAAHWACGEALGYSMGFHLNGVRSPAGILPRHQTLVDLAGPAVTIIQALLAWRIAARTRSHRAFAFLYAAAFMRVVAFGISFFYLNDEARVSVTVGMPFWVLPLVVSAGLIALTWHASRRLATRWTDQLLCYVVGSLATTAIVMGDRLLA
jgi:hypothetical protein